MLTSVYHKYPAIVPASPFIYSKAPDKVKKLKPIWTPDGYILFWTAPNAKHVMDEAVEYVVYRFGKKEKINLNDATHIVTITRNTFYKLPYTNGDSKYKYVVTALNRLKMEAASEVGVTLKDGYNGDLTSRQAGQIGGNMVKKMIESYENSVK